MLVSRPPQAVGQHEEQGSCDEIEDFVKSFIPSLFDSESDSEDIFYPQSSLLSGPTTEMPHLSKPLTILSSGTELGGFHKAEPFAEASSPSSQGNSSLSNFRPQLDSSGSLDDQSTFQSMLSIASNATVLDAVFEDDTPVSVVLEEERPVKRAKITPAQGLQRSASQPASKPFAVDMASSKEEHLFPKTGPHMVCNTGCHQCQLPRAVSLQCLAPLPPEAPVSTVTSIVTGHPAPQPRNAPATSLPWTSPHPMQQPRGSLAVASAPGPWPAPQSMIPTAPMSAFYQHHGTAPQPQAPPAGGTESISQALKRVAANPFGKAPLGLKLDKTGIVRQINETGMRVATL